MRYLGADSQHTSEDCTARRNRGVDHARSCLSMTIDIGKKVADPLFQLILTRYERCSTIITTNFDIGGWGKVFGDDMVASDIADQVCHCRDAIKITGGFYPLKDPPRERRDAE